MISLLLACNWVSKVPLSDVNAGFTLSDLAWFQEEETLFVFYEVFAQQGITDPTVIEIAFTTDEGEVDWTALDAFTPVHTHVDGKCEPPPGTDILCGSTSIHVPLEPRNVRMRLRYHREGELALDADTIFNAVGNGPPHTHRSLLVYGVFNEANNLVQWRSRHRFPTIRNAEATRLGLRRDFTVADIRFGTGQIATPENPYGYAAGCPASFTATTLPQVTSNERAVFSDDMLPQGALPHSSVCALSTVTDALGDFDALTLARKNPEVRPAFPLMRSPVRDAQPVKFFLAPCAGPFDPEHEEMQRQRLQMSGIPTTCTEGWDQPGWIESLVADFSFSIETQRVSERDMVLVVGLHQDQPGLSEAVEEALAELVPNERHRSSPRLAGSFVFDSTNEGIENPELASATLWCPSTVSLTDIPDASGRSCPVLPDLPQIDLGPLDYGNIPILPSADDYRDFIDDFSVAQAGEVQALTYRAPEFATTSEHIDFGEFGVISFLNDESLLAQPQDAFSYCPTEDFVPVVFRTPFMRQPGFQQQVINQCAQGNLPEELCANLLGGAGTLEWLPAWHNTVGEGTYSLGLFWDFPFLTHIEYRSVFAASITGFGVTIPFGFGNDTEAFYGTEFWLADSFALDTALTQCTEFCDHPTFDVATVYHVTDPFRSTYETSCYNPRYPVPGDSGFPLDP